MSRVHWITPSTAVFASLLGFILTAPLQAQVVKVVGYDGKVREVDESKNRYPQVIRKVAATYTREAWDAQLQGSVEISFKLGADGVPTDIEVVEGLGMGLDGQAVAAVSQWRFQPPMRDGKVVPSNGTIGIVFKMQEDQRYQEE